MEAYTILNLDLKLEYGNISTKHNVLKVVSQMLEHGQNKISMLEFLQIVDIDINTFMMQIDRLEMRIPEKPEVGESLIKFSTVKK